MCFSATASFSAGIVLLAVGALTLKSVTRKADLPFAVIPLLFAIQQLDEGVVWLTLGQAAPLLNAVATRLYSFFSHVLWPIYLPLAVLMMEPRGLHRRVLIGFAVAGGAVGAYLLYVLVAFPVASRQTGQHIEYVSPHFFALEVMTLYLMATALSPLLSTQRRVQIFGALALTTFAAAYYFYATWFISVWCFFAALLSVVVYLHVAQRKSDLKGHKLPHSAID